MCKNTIIPPVLASGSPQTTSNVTHTRIYKSSFMTICNVSTVLLLNSHDTDKQSIAGFNLCLENIHLSNN